MNIDVRSLGVTLDNSRILDNINLRIENGKFVGIVGPNGSGKSTLLKCIYRTLRPRDGIIRLDERDLAEFTLKESARKLGVIAQQSSFDFDFAVLEAVLMGRSPHKKIMERDNCRDYEIARRALNAVGMESFAERSLATLSGGERQRVLLARALAQEAECLILDEPTNHLDLKYQLELMNIIKELKVTVVAAIHDLNIAALYCDYILAMKNGRLFGCGRPCELFTEELIYELFEVRTRVFKDEESGRIYIRYERNG